MKIEPLKIKIEASSLKFEEDNGEFCTIQFHRTLRLPMDDKIYPLPPSFGQFPICKVEDYADKVPESWKAHGGVFIPMFQREAMWIEFGNKDGYHYPFALKVAVGKVNAITGEPYNQVITSGKQDYVVIPTQPWLDGINAGEGVIKQFVAMPLGGGYTVEAQVTGEEKFGGIQLVAFPPKNKAIPPPKIPQKREMLSDEPKWFKTNSSALKKKSGGVLGGMFDFFSGSSASATTNVPPAACSPMMAKESAKFEECKECEDAAFDDFDASSLQRGEAIDDLIAQTESLAASAQTFAASASASENRRQRNAPTITKKDKAAEMGLSAGGKMKQKIISDPHGASYWDEVNFGRVYVHIVNSELYYQITGDYPPPTPIDASAYTNFGYPWYDYYSENSQNSVPESNILSNIKDVKQIDQDKFAFPQQDDTTVPIPGYQVKKIVKKDPHEVTDGDW